MGVSSPSYLAPPAPDKNEMMMAMLQLMMSFLSKLSDMQSDEGVSSPPPERCGTMQPPTSRPGALEAPQEAPQGNPLLILDLMPQLRAKQDAEPVANDYAASATPERCEAPGQTKTAAPAAAAPAAAPAADSTGIKLPIDADAATCVRSKSAKDLTDVSPLPKEVGSVKPIGPHGIMGGMQDYKDNLNADMDKLGIQDPTRRQQILAFAMMEGAKEHELDRTKDGTDSANGFLNINARILMQAGEPGDEKSLAPGVPSLSRTDAVMYLDKALDREIAAHGEETGLDNVKRAQRGGSTTLGDGVSYEYRKFDQNYDFTVQSMAKDPSLMTDDRRVWTETPYQTGSGPKPPAA